MQARNTRSVVLTLLMLAAFGSVASASEVVLDGLNEPRGLWILADGTLCVAEAGHSAGAREVGVEDAFYEGPTAILAHTGSVSCVDTKGVRARVIERLPYVRYDPFGVTTGAADIVEMDGALFVLTGEGQGQLAHKLLRIDGSSPAPEVVADFRAFATEATPPGFADTTIVSNPFALIEDPPNGRFLVTDGATGQVLAADLDGGIEVFSDVTGHHVLAGIVRGPDGLAYVASFSNLPHEEGEGAVLRVLPDGSSSVVAGGLTTPIDLAFDSSARLYVLEFGDASETGDPYRGKTGRLVRLERDGDGWAGGQVLVLGLPFPTALLIDADDRVYISVHGAFSSAGSGLVVRSTIWRSERQTIRRSCSPRAPRDEPWP